MRREFQIEEGEDGSRLETFLRRHLGLARPVALKALRKGWVRVDGKRAKGAHRLTRGQVVKITNYALPLPAVDGTAPVPEAPAEWVAAARESIRFEDEDLVVSLKPAGRAVHRGTGHPVGWIDAVGAAIGVKLTPVGRLDRDTSGLLALARSALAVRRLFEDLKAGALSRTYEALVAGSPQPSSGTIDRPLRPEGPPGSERVRVSDEGKDARTRYELIEAFPQASLLRLELETGRKHQIRVHLESIGCPVLGDPRYGDAAARRLAQELGVPRLFLHARVLRLRHPKSGEALEFDAPLPATLQRALAKAAGR